MLFEVTFQLMHPLSKMQNNANGQNSYCLSPTIQVYINLLEDFHLCLAVENQLDIAFNGRDGLF